MRPINEDLSKFCSELDQFNLKLARIRTQAVHAVADAAESTPYNHSWHAMANVEEAFERSTIIPAIRVVSQDIGRLTQS